MYLHPVLRANIHPQTHAHTYTYKESKLSRKRAKVTGLALACANLQSRVRRGKGMVLVAEFSLPPKFATHDCLATILGFVACEEAVTTFADALRRLVFRSICNQTHLALCRCCCRGRRGGGEQREDGRSCPREE